jgi:predicted O-methyltransferase YrrM
MQIVQDEREITICVEAVKRLAPTAILEIGSFQGGTLGLWLQTGARHVVSIDVDHSQLHREELERIKVPGQALHLVEGRSGHPETIERLDALMKAIGVARFDVAYIDGAHHYEGVKLDFATCLPRTSKAIILNDPVLNDVRVFVDELSRAHHGWDTALVVNPNRSLPSVPGAYHGTSDYVAETGAGNFIVMLDPRHRDVMDDVRDRVARELAPLDPAFEPTRLYFHRRGLAHSPEYAAYWNGLYPRWGAATRLLFKDAWSLYERSREEQRVGHLEASLRSARQAARARAQWKYHLLKRIVLAVSGGALRRVVRGD